ncbi:MFS transporter [Rouxiella sp. Mn2063]|uniref:MFS transporter n=1 Tax=Rouxiella sp. Mn2063 TaxID=3395262 RepID=UPI003BD976CD
MKKSSFMIFLLFLGYVLIYTDKMAIGFSLLPISKEFHLRSDQLGYITGGFFLAYSIFQLPFGWLTDRWGYKKLLPLSLGLLGIFAISFGLLGASLGLLIVIRFLAGIGHSGYPPSCAKAVVSNYSFEQRTFAQSVLLSSSGVAQVVGPLLALWALSTIGWRDYSVILGIIALLLAGCVLFLVPAPITKSSSQSTPEHRTSHYREALKSSLVILLFLSMFCINMSVYGLMAWLPKYMVQQRELPLGTSSAIMALSGAGSWLAFLVTGWVVGRHMQGKEPQVMVVFSVLSGVAVWCLGNSRGELAITLSLVASIICITTAFLTGFTLPMKRLPIEIIGGTMGVLNSGGILGGFVAPIVMGYLISPEHGYTYAFLFLSLAMIIAGLFMLPLIRKVPVALHDVV